MLPESCFFRLKGLLEHQLKLNLKTKKRDSSDIKFQIIAIMINRKMLFDILVGIKL